MAPRQTGNSLTTARRKTHIAEGFSGRGRSQRIASTRRRRLRATLVTECPHAVSASAVGLVRPTEIGVDEEREID